MAQLTLQQLREFGIVPDTSLGQHFLVDDNILEVIARLSAVSHEDVVYEPGPGVGVLTSFLAQRVSYVHAVEIDRRLAPALQPLVDSAGTVALRWEDATATDVAALEPAVTALVSNLPYHVAGPIIAEVLQHAPSVRTFCVMVQKEVAERFFAPVGSSSYGALSVLVQALCSKTGSHRVSRSVFLPRPNVDSQLVAFRRDREPVPAGDVPAFARFVRSVFAHRRKTVHNNLAASGIDRARAAELVAATGSGPTARPQELTPERFVQLWQLAAAVTGPPAHDGGRGQAREGG